MNCCDRILILFLTFSFIQFSFRWERDSEKLQEPWQMYIKGKSDLLNPTSSSLIQFQQQATGYGNPTIHLSPTKIFSTDRSEIKIDINLHVKGPAMSFHKFSFLDKEITLFANPAGVASSTMSTSLIHLPSSPIEMTYHFVDIWNVEGSSSLSVDMVIQSGHFSLWDVKWSDVYIP